MVATLEAVNILVSESCRGVEQTNKMENLIIGRTKADKN